MIKVKHTPAKAKKRIDTLQKNLSGPGTVKVGLPANSGAYPDGTSVLMVGIVHEFGSPKNGIPQRSFLRSTLNANRRAYMQLIKKLGKQVFLGKIDGAKALQLLGLRVQTDVRQKITDIKEPALTYREGNPLVQTGLLRSSITYVVEE